MQIAKITRVYVNPPQSNEFTIEIYWRYPGEATYRFFGERVANADGTLQNPASISYDDAINMNIEIRLVFAYCPTTVPYVYTHNGAVTTTSTTTISPMTGILNETPYQIDFSLDGNTQIVEPNSNQNINTGNPEIFILQVVDFGNLNQVYLALMDGNQMVFGPVLVTVGDTIELPDASAYDTIRFYQP